MGKPNKHGVDKDGYIVEDGFFGGSFEPEPDPFEEELDEEAKAKQRFVASGKGLTITPPKKN